MIEPRLAALATVLCGPLLCCGHGELFRAPDAGTGAPYFTGAPVRITLNAGTDLWPTWLPDGSGILYTSERLDRPDRDWCLVVLPPSGGRITRTICDNTKVGEDSVETMQSAAPGPDGRLAYVRSSGVRGQLFATGRFARSRDLVLASLGAPTDRRSLSSIPFTIPAVRTFTSTSGIGWLDSTTLVYRGDFLGQVCLIQVPNCPQAFVQSGLAIIVHTLGETPARTILPGTDYASSVVVGMDTDELYFTLGGDPRVLRYTISTGVITVVYDFGAAGFARDIQVRGSKLVAVVGGPTVSYGLNASVNLNLQIDTIGGEIHVVDLIAGTDTTISGGRFFRHLALSPAGDRLVAESVAAGLGDLWLFEVP